MIAMDSADAFRRYIAEDLGFEPPKRLEPGQWAPFSTNGKAGNTAGRAKLFPDGEGGVVHDWRSGEQWIWQAKRESSRTDQEQQAWRQKCDRAREDALKERERAAGRTKERAAALWAEATPAADDHAYLKKKGVKAHGLRVYRGPFMLNGMRCDGALVVPARNTAGELVSLSFISPEGEKRYLSGPREPGCYFGIGKPDGLLCIVEGFATGASIHEATGHAVAVAFDAGNLPHTAAALREKFDSLPLTICADNDCATEGNPGVTKATEAAHLVGGLVAVPVLEGRAEPLDFNDLYAAAGSSAVRQCLNGATAPGKTAPMSRLGGVRLARGDEIEIVGVDWYWNGYLPKGKMVLIGGAPGTGKTTLAIALAATITCGGRWPDGTRAEKGDVLIWSGEDAVSDTLAPRFKAANADMSRVHFVMDVNTVEGGRQFDPSTDFPALLTAAKGISDLRLVIVDPIVMAIAGDSHKNAETRRGLKPLVEFAERAGAVVLGVTHFSKGTQGREPMERITGSLAFAAVARLILVAAKIDEANGGGRVLVRSKSNLGPDGGGFKYELEQVDLAPGVVTSRALWGEPLEGNARDILAAAEITSEPGEQEEQQGAKEWLEATLAEGGGELLKTEVMRRGREAGFPERTLQRARERLRAVAKVEGFGRDKRSVWRLPERPIHANEPPFVPIMPSRLSGTDGMNAGTDEEVFQ